MNTTRRRFLGLLAGAAAALGLRLRARAAPPYYHIVMDPASNSCGEERDCDTGYLCIVDNTGRIGIFPYESTDTKV